MPDSPTKPPREAEPYSIDEQGNKVDGWIWDELLGDDDLDEGQYRHVVGEDAPAEAPAEPPVELSAYRRKLRDLMNLGGPGSGNFGHAGRPGEVGGSSSDGSAGGSSDGSAGGSRADAGTTRALPHRPLTQDEKGKLSTYVAKETAKLAGANPTEQTAADLKTLQQPHDAYPHAENEHAGGKAAHSFQQFTTPGTSTADAIKAMETGARGVLTPERQELHDAIVRLHTGTAPAVDRPSVVVMGGGPASGKSSMPKGEASAGAITVDPDAIRVMLSDYAVKAGGPDVLQAAVFTHEEASALAKRIANEAGATRNLIIDGTGDKSVDSMVKKLEGYRKEGQRVVGRYATNDVEEAQRRAELRAQHPPYRSVPDQALRVTHAGVSRVLPTLMERDAFDHVELWDTNVPQGTPARLVMSKTRGEPEVIHDDALWADFLAKGTVTGKTRD